MSEIEEVQTEDTSSEEKKSGGAKKILLRAFDIFSGVVLLLVFIWFLPIFLLVKWLEDLQNPWLTQTELDKNGKEFKRFTINVYCPHADELKERLIAAGFNEAQLPAFKMKDDPRLTAVGKLYRKYKIENIPSIINVIAGSLTVFDLFK